jgi:uncharacterized protein
MSNKNSNLEIRAITKQLELRTVNGQRTVNGMIPYNTRSVDLGGFVETIASNAFTKSLRDNPDVRLLANHNWDQPLARTESGTMTLQNTRDGLTFSASMPNTTYANDLIESMERGDVSDVSFGFTTDEDAWGKEADGLVRTLLSVSLAEISLVTAGAYPDSTVSLRSCPDALRHLVGLPTTADIADNSLLLAVLLAKRRVY